MTPWILQGVRMSDTDSRPCAVSFNNNASINGEILTILHSRPRRSAGLKVLTGEYMLIATTRKFYVRLISAFAHSPPRSPDHHHH